MKGNPTKPTRRQKLLLDKLRLDPAEWLVCCESENYIVLMSRYTNKTITKCKK